MPERFGAVKPDGSESAMIKADDIAARTQIREATEACAICTDALRFDEVLDLLA